MTVACVRDQDHGNATTLIAFDDDSNAPGRLLAYCDACVREVAPTRIVLPLTVFYRHPENFLDAFYANKVTETQPTFISDTFGVPPGTWTATAWAAIEETRGSLSDQPPAWERAARPFASAIRSKVHALRSGFFSDVQARRLRESITDDLRKCSDVLTPEIAPVMMSLEAERHARAIGVDLTIQTWHTQTSFDPGRTIFHFEHFYPVGAIRSACLETESTDEVLSLIHDRLRVAWITKTEDAELRRLGFASKRPEPAAAYAAAGISLISAPV